MDFDCNHLLGENYLVSSSKLQRLYMQMCIDAVKDYCFTSCEVAILLFLDNNKPLDTAKDITTYRGISKGLVCKNVDLLISKGFLSTCIDDKDKRYIHLSITPDASEIIKKLRSARNEFFSILFNGISEEEINCMRKTTSKMMENINLK
ncbi:MAG: MarR family winged helix-turn-helix transcriptional regulator [Oscillospiraceae bacterium]